MSAGKKRYYAVVRGRRPGIYTAWEGHDGARAQVSGFAGAVYKGFATPDEARHFLATACSRPPSPARAVRAPRNDRLPLAREGYIHIYTDGGCIDNPGPGGWGAVIISGDERTEISGGYRLTTNNRMELTACIQALGTLGETRKVQLFTDSQYVANAVEKGWAKRWRDRGWMRDRSHRAENADLWAELLGIIERHQVTFHWVRGHAGNPENERCDVLAGEAARRQDLPRDTGYEQALKDRDTGLFE